MYKFLGQRVTYLLRKAVAYPGILFAGEGGFNKFS